MPTYRAHVKGPDGHFIDQRDIAAIHDDEAIAHARRLAEDRPIEVWMRDRMVTKIDPAQGMPGNLFKLSRRRRQP